MELTQEYLKSILSYEPKEGLMLWKENRSQMRSGDKVGHYSAQKNAYSLISIDGRLYKSHRIIWFIVTSSFPSGEIDHIDHNRQNNRWSNLRDVPIGENNKNCSISKVNTSGTTGVQWFKAKKRLIATIQFKRKRRHLGCYDDINEAIVARKLAEIELGFHKNHGCAVVG